MVLRLRIIKYLLCLLRTNSTNVPHKWDQNPGQPHPQIPQAESLQK